MIGIKNMGARSGQEGLCLLLQKMAKFRQFTLTETALLSVHLPALNQSAHNIMSN
jgi:hypothetical protein